MSDDEVISVGKPLPRISGAVPGNGRLVSIIWRDGETQTVDLLPTLTRHQAFGRLLTDDALFRRVAVSEFGDCLEWPDGAQLPATSIEQLIETQPSGGYDTHFSPEMKAVDREFAEKLPDWWYMAGVTDGIAWAQVSPKIRAWGGDLVLELPVPATEIDALKMAMVKVLAGEQGEYILGERPVGSLALASTKSGA